MDNLEKLNRLIAQVDARIEQIDETTLNEDQKNMLQEFKSRNLKQQAAIAIAKKEKENN
jgi:hypothetical protein